MSDKKNIEITADALTVIRSDEYYTKELGIIDPYAKFFVTDMGKKMVQMAMSVDNVYVEFNLSRYQYMTEEFYDKSNDLDQILLLGAGYDTRPLNHEIIKSNKVSTFEVDFKDKLEDKWKTLHKEGIKSPSWIKSIYSNLDDDTLKTKLKEAGYNYNEKTGIILEGVTFFLPEEVSSEILNPKFFELSKGSTIIFDYWKNNRINTLNERVKEKTGKNLFKNFPFNDDSIGLENDLIKLGYSSVDICSLDEISSKFYNRKIMSEFKDSWFVVVAKI